MLPEGQELLYLEAKMSAGHALDRLADHGYSQAPVRDQAGEIINVFSYYSFGHRMAELQNLPAKIKPVDLPVTELSEPVCDEMFIAPETYIDTATDWSKIDYVIVGSPSSALGILTLSDVFGRLSDFAEAFVLLYEIEHEIRDVILDVIGEDRLVDIIANLRLPEGMRPPQSLKDFTFSQYKTVICSRTSWSLFEPIFDRMREVVQTDFERVTHLRNTVFHFRSKITPKDTDMLRRFRDRLKDDRQLYLKKKSGYKKRSPK